MLTPHDVQHEHNLLHEDYPTPDLAAWQIARRPFLSPETRLDSPGKVPRPGHESPAGRLAHPLQEPPQHRLHLRPGQRIERAKRLIHQQHHRVCRQRSSQTHPLPLPTRELPGIPRPKLLYSNPASANTSASRAAISCFDRPAAPTPSPRSAPPSYAETAPSPGSHTRFPAAEPPCHSPVWPYPQPDLPEVGVTSPFTVRNSVVFPDPLRPSRAVVDPASSCREISRSKTRPSANV